MSNESNEFSGGQTTEPWQENFTEKQALDYAATSEPVKLKLCPIIIVITVLSSFYLILFIIGMAFAFGKSMNDVKEAIEFNKV
uniref:Uncharacterized protein n=1 Tax=Panagrolaimus sp. PS1159 TaxID=55785 RepID=A0AC35F744_9BILA